VVADVGAEKAEQPLVVAARHVGLAQQHDAVGFVVDPGQAQATQLLEEAARVHVLGHRLGEAFEAGGGALARQRLERRALVAQRRIGDPACKDLGRGCAPRRGLRRFGLEQARDLPPVDAGGRADAAHRPVRRHVGMGFARSLHERSAHQLVELGVLHAARDRQPRQRRHHGMAGMQQQGIIGTGGRTSGDRGVRREIHGSLISLDEASLNVPTAHFNGGVAKPSQKAMSGAAGRTGGAGTRAACKVEAKPPRRVHRRMLGRRPFASGAHRPV
jgi:hypothetical protein